MERIPLHVCADKLVGFIQRGESPVIEQYTARASRGIQEK